MINSDIYSEKDLLLRIAEGEEKAFKKLVREYSPMLFTYIYRHTDSAPVAEEIVQDIFLQVWITRESLIEIRSFRKWLFVLARNHAVNALKKIIRERKFKRGIDLSNAVSEENRDYIQEDLHLTLIEEAIKQLPAKQRQAWELSRRHSLTYNQIAAEMNISRETVKTHLQIANAGIAKYVTERMDFWLLLVWLKNIS